MNRRTFLASSAAAALLRPRAAAGSARLPIKKAVEFEMLPKKISVVDRFQLARDAGFEQIECPTMPDERDAAEAKKAAEKTGLRIHSVMNQAHWKYPLSSADPAVVAESVKGMETSLRNAHFWGADTVLLVPAVVNPKTSYRDAWTRSQEQIRKLIPKAAELKVIIGVEEVWNKFLLSPLEFARYVDDFQSPWLKAYFDVGNVVIWGYPQDWIRTLGSRIAKLHLKDFSYRQNPEIKKRVPDFVMLREGDIDWKEVYRALHDIGYRGSATVGLGGGHADYLRDVSQRVDLILNGQ